MSMETDRIEADLNESRHRLNDTLSALGSKLSPGQMLDEVLGLAQGQAGQFASKLGTQVKENPLPTLLIAAGVGMLFLTRGSNGSAVSHDDWHSERHYRSLEEARWSTPRNANESDDAYNERVHLAYAKTLDLKRMAGEAAHEFKARVSKTVDGIQRRAGDVRDRMSQTAANVSQYAQDQTQRLGASASKMSHRAQDLYQDTPLAAGAIALAVGAIIGSATPLSNAERDGLQGVADKATRMGADIAERGARAVSQEADSAMH